MSQGWTVPRLRVSFRECKDHPLLINAVTGGLQRAKLGWRECCPSSRREMRADLIQTTSMCTNGTQNRALVRTLIRYGARAADLAQVSWRLCRMWVRSLVRRGRGTVRRVIITKIFSPCRHRNLANQLEPSAYIAMCAFSIHRNISMFHIHLFLHAVCYLLCLVDSFTCMNQLLSLTETFWLAHQWPSS